jgi:50S ribosomal protein L16 3-hydroxylase
VPLKVLQNFEPEEEFVLNAGDMLYLPPGYAHDGIAEAAVCSDRKPVDCMTYSIGFRVPGRGELAAELLRRLAEFSEDEEEALAGGEGRRRAGRPPRLYQDPGQAATATPAELPAALAAFAGQAVLDALKDPLALNCALGEYMTAPKPTVWFEEPLQGWDAAAAKSGQSSVQLDARTRMMYDGDHVFINGESYRAKGADARFMRLLADQRSLVPDELRKASASALALLDDWHGAGWLRQEA